MKKFFVLLIAILCVSSTCFANVQSRPDRAKLVNQTANQFFIKIRNMEASGGVLGKDASINQTTGVETTSNGIDSHMCKNTEYGAAAILSVSQYGHATAISEESVNYNASTSTITNLGDSTTGAPGTESYYYGLFDMSNNYSSDKTYNKYTYLAGIYNAPGDPNLQYCSILDNAAKTVSLQKYVDIYPNPNPIASGESHYYGDATTETSLWRGASTTYFPYATGPVSIRRGGFFGFHNNTGDGGSGYGARAVIVSGAGI